MAFAQKGNGNASPFTTEKDLIRQVASNITKEQLVVRKTDDSGSTELKLQGKVAGESKRIMAENVAKNLKVWYSFVKFIKNQVNVNGRLVDTQLIGLFGKDANGDVFYMPSKDYLEAGKFKLQRGVGSLVEKLQLDQGGDYLEQYFAKYQEKLESTSKGEQAQLSFASLSLITNSTKEQVRRFLTDFFAALVEVSRKTNKEARIKMKDFGTIYLFKNRELAFKVLDDNIDLVKLDQNNVLFLERQKEREDLSFIDQASAILSRGGGQAFSLRSSTMKSLSSVMTAPTNPSVRSSIMQSSQRSGGLARSSYSTQTGGSRKGQIGLAPLKQDVVWQRYKKKNEMQNREREQRKAESLHETPSNKRIDTLSFLSGQRSSIQVNLAPKVFDINMKVHTNAPTTIPDLLSAPHNFASPNKTTSSKVSQSLNVSGERLPYPFLQGFLDRKTGNRFNKKVHFDRSDYDDLLGKIIDQIHEKKDREMFEKLQERDEEQNLLQYQREQMFEEQTYESEDKVHKTNAFIQANQILKDEKNERQNNDIKMKAIERLNFFPFTHGDMIEKQRKALNELQKHEQMNAIKERAMEEIRRKRNQAKLNTQANEQMQTNFEQKVLQEQMVKKSQRDAFLKRSPRVADQSVEEVQQKKIGRSDLFLKNSSAHLPPRRKQLGVTHAPVNDDQDSQAGENQYQLAMSEALARHEEELIRVGELRKLQEMDFRQQLQMQEDIAKAEKEQESFKKLQLHQELSKQMREGQIKKEAMNNEKKDKVVTSGGPTMHAEDAAELKRKYRNQQLLIQLQLQKQMDMGQEERKAMRSIEIDAERLEADRVAIKNIEAKLNKQKQQKEAISHFKAVWEAQISLKEKNEAMENVF